MNDQLIDNIELILNTLKIDFTHTGNRIIFPCPIHGSNKNDSLSILLEGHTVNGIWKCWTQNCEEKWGKSLFSLIRALLSQTEYKSIDETKKWIENVIGNIDQYDTTLISYIKLASRDTKVENGKITRDYVRTKLKRPAHLFLDRNFSSSILDKYDIGVSYNKGNMYLRTVVPIYDENYQYMVGCIGRSPCPQCPQCNLFHYTNRNCPSNNLEKKWAAKWINSNFASGNYLFNLWFAKQSIFETGTIILVESAMDSIRLSEANIYNTVALFGDKLTDNQHSILNNLPIHTVILALDNDKAGQEASLSIENQIQRYFNIKKVIPIKKDWADHSIQEIKNIWNIK